MVIDRLTGEQLLPPVLHMAGDLRVQVIMEMHWLPSDAVVNETSPRSLHRCLKTFLRIFFWSRFLLVNIKKNYFPSFSKVKTTRKITRGYIRPNKFQARTP